MLAQYVDGVLPAAEADAIREHLMHCARCTEAERVARSIPMLLTNPIDPPPPPTLLPRIMSGLHRVRHSERQVAAIVAASLLLAAGAAMAGPAPLTQQAGVGAHLLQLARLKPAFSEPQLAGPARLPVRAPFATPADAQLPQTSATANQPTSAAQGTTAPLEPATQPATATAPAAIDAQPQQPQPPQLPAQQSAPQPAVPQPVAAPVLTAPPLTASPAACPAPSSPADSTATSGGSALPATQAASSTQSVTQLPDPGCPAETQYVPSVSLPPAPTLAPIGGVPPNS